jgi:hypothetical protein
MNNKQEKMTNEDVKVMFAQETGITTYSPMGENEYIKWLEKKYIKLLTKEKKEMEELKILLKRSLVALNDTHEGSMAYKPLRNEIEKLLTN